MFPIIWKYQMLTIGGYGVMLGLGFYLGFLLGEREFRLRGIDPELAYKLLLTVIPSAIIGAKLFHILDNLDSFFNAPMDMIFSGAGLSAYGGFILALVAAAILIRINGYDILEVFDASSPTLAFGYGVGRLGCHVAGDGCYGIATSSIFGMAYPNGIVPTSVEVFPTPLFESLLSFIFAAVLLNIRKKDTAKGTIFFIYLVMNGLARFSVEFIRLNPRILGSLTQAQLIAIGFMLTGILGLFLLKRRSSTEA